MMVLGAARFAALRDPHNAFFVKLKALGYKTKVAVDIGAYEGHWTLALKRTFPAARVLMIEAQPGKTEVLAAVAAKLENVSHRNCMVGDRSEGDVAFHVMDTPCGSTGSSIYPEQTSLRRNAVALDM